MPKGRIDDEAVVLPQRTIDRLLNIATSEPTHIDLQDQEMTTSV